MRASVGATYESANERRTVTKVTKAGVVSYRTAFLTHDFDGPDPAKLIWQPSDQPARTASKMDWAQWCAWASDIAESAPPT